MFVIINNKTKKKRKQQRPMMMQTHRHFVYQRLIELDHATALKKKKLKEQKGHKKINIARKVILYNG
jgi:hypothetical protein